MKSLGLHNVLLTEAESRCYLVARAYQRKTLLRQLFVGSGSLWADYKRLAWSKSPAMFVVQLLTFCLLMPLFLLQIVIKKTIQVLLFPFEYGKTYYVPAGLSAPGEKTLAGIHHAFTRHITMGEAEYVSCLTDWIGILYGEQTARQFDVKRYLDMQALQYHEARRRNADVDQACRAMVTLARDKLSKELGHYGVAQKQLH